MQEYTQITGMVLKAEPVGEYDRRVVILTKEKGKISAFARGARKPNSRLLAATNPFSFGEFKLYAGRNSYTVMDARSGNYFEGLREDLKEPTTACISGGGGLLYEREQRRAGDVETGVPVAAGSVT